MYSAVIPSDLPDQVDDLVFKRLHADDTMSDAVLAFHRTKPIPKINVPANHGKLLHFFIKMMGAKRILEIGTLAGYSTVWMAKDLPADGLVTTIDFDEKHIQIAEQTFAMTDMQDKIRMMHGKAQECLELLVKEHKAGLIPSFDFIFIDADKQNNPVYLDYCMELSRSGTVIVADNMVRDGKVVTETDRAPNIRGIRQYFQKLHDDPRLDSTVIQTVGHKGWDGFAITMVK
ncbi:O-methyltransferase [Pelistega europaea]|uniref:O-methyltransferase n=1 Tax=Pelistega europaea TaxID=106147 RepID=A0A7Y4P5Z6_9BURK|nr:O-methyltransferase [Pelistega europaea]NOL49245.1 O-methyltransferase [Pelistega europaea]